MYLDEPEIFELLPPRAAVAAIENALRSGLMPHADPERQAVALGHGQFLIMPSEAGGAAGVKIATVAPNNPASGIPRIQATYLLFDSQTLSHTATLDGTALTTLRTPAVSVAAVRTMLESLVEPLNVVIFGGGPQGRAHLATIVDTVAPVVRTVTWVVRDPTRASESLASLGRVVETSDSSLASVIRSADVIVCATSAREPLFDGDLVKDGAVVMAVGSHEPDARELDPRLLARAQVIVEDIGTALRECGDVVMAIDDGHIVAADLLDLASVVNYPAMVGGDRPVVFKSSGMSWEDLVVANAVVRAHVKRAGSALAVTSDISA